MANSYIKEIQDYVDSHNVMENLLAAHPRQQELNKRFLEYHGRIRGNPRMVITEDQLYKGNYQVNFSYQPTDASAKLINLCLDLYPHCCALHQLNNFQHGHEKFLDTEFFLSFVAECIRQYSIGVNTPRRLMINFVEWTRTEQFSVTDTEIPLDPKSQVGYHLFYEWAKKHQHIETLFVNHNTNRVIHNVIITL